MSVDEKFLLVFRIIHAIAALAFFGLSRNLWYHRRHPTEGMSFKMVDVVVKMHLNVQDSSVSDLTKIEIELPPGSPEHHMSKRELARIMQQNYTNLRISMK